MARTKMNFENEEQRIEYEEKRREYRKQYARQYQRQQRAKMTDEERIHRNNYERERRAKQRADLSVQEREARMRQHSEYMRAHRARISQQEIHEGKIDEQLLKRKLQRAIRRDQMTDTERQLLRQRNREAVQRHRLIHSNVVVDHDEGTTMELEIDPTRGLPEISVGFSGENEEQMYT